MGNLFNIENGFFRFMGKLFDVFALSIVFTAVCIPIITIGPAVTALYYASVKAIRHNRSYPMREFFKSFKRDFKQSAIVWLILIILGIILYVDMQFVNMYISNIFASARYIYFIIAMVVSFISVYIFPLISRFSLKISAFFRLAFYLAIRHFLTTAVSVILLFGSFIAVYITGGLALIFIPVTVTLLISILMEKVLVKCLTLVGSGVEDENKDQWYLD